MDAEELRQRYKAGERDFAGIHVNNIDLSRIYLARANLQGAKFIQTNLNNADFGWADLFNADFSGSNLCYANFDEAILRNAIFQDADLNRAELIGADLTGVDLTQALNVSTTYLLRIDEKNNSHTELVKTLKNLTRGLRRLYPTEVCMPYDVFLWDVASRGDFTLEKFLKAIGLLVEIQLIDLSESKFPIEEYSSLLNYIRPYLAEYKFYFLKVCHKYLDRGSGIPLLLVILKSEYFFAISPQSVLSNLIGVDEEDCNLADRRKASAEASSKNQDLVCVLTKANAEINFTNFDEFVESFICEFDKDQKALLINLLIANETIVIKDFSDIFFEGDEELYREENPERYQNIEIFLDFIKGKLKNIRVYSFNDSKSNLYIVGQTDEGDWLGVHTQLKY